MSRNFDGVDDIISAPGTNLDNLTAFTWCAWIKPRTAGENTVGRIAVKGDTTERKWFYISQAAPNTNVAYEMLTSATSRRAIPINGMLNPLDIWYFIAVTYSAADGGPRIWKGTLNTAVAETSYQTRTDGTGTNVPETGETLKIGNRNAGDRTFDGLIAHLSFWSSVLTGGKLERLRTSTFHPALAAEFSATCVGYWRLAESETAPDLSGNGNNGTISGATAAVDPPLVVMRQKRRRS